MRKINTGEGIKCKQKKKFAKREKNLYKVIHEFIKKKDCLIDVGDLSCCDGKVGSILTCVDEINPNDAFWTNAFDFDCAIQLLRFDFQPTV